MHPKLIGFSIRLQLYLLLHTEEAWCFSSTIMPGAHILNLISLNPTLAHKHQLS